MHDDRSIEWGFAGVPIRGETVSGDSHIVKPVPAGFLIAAVDGLGHGHEAAAASRIAVTTLETYAGEPVIMLARRCHEALKGTRGVVMSIAKLNFDNNMMTWLGVGNIEGLLLKGNAISRERLLLRGGILGYQLPPLREAVIPFMSCDTLIFLTDGIRRSFDGGIKICDRTKKIEDDIMSKYNRGTDDALVQVVRYTCK